MSKVHIIGAGLAGLSAAVSLSQAGRQIVLYEASGQTGGRCRSFTDPQLEITIDNGNHLLLEANKASLAFLDTIKALPYWQQQTGGYSFCNLATQQKWQLSAPLWLPDIPWRDKTSLLRLIMAGRHATLADIFNQDTALWQRWLAPFCISALNTRPQEASATLFRQMLWRILCTGSKGARPWLATQPLQQALIDPALRCITSRGGQIRYHTALKRMEYDSDNVSALIFEGETVAVKPDEHVIVATAASSAQKLLPQLIVPDAYESVVNGHFQYKAPQHAPKLLGVTGGSIDWVFVKKGVISTTTSAASRFDTLSAEMLWQDVQATLDFSAPLPPHRIVTEKRATFKASPEQLIKRPGSKTPYNNLHLAGDYTQTSLPATIEGSIISGQKAASRIFQR